jgi:molybdopterin molybdotransferase
MLSVDEALERLLAATRPVTDLEILPLEQASGRVLAGPVSSGIDVPSFDNSAMDGYAVRAADAGADSLLRVSGRIAAGDVPGSLEPGTAMRIFTGAPLPNGADSVVMQENSVINEGNVRILDAPRIGENVRRAGEDIRSGALLIESGVRLRPAALGVAASVGSAELSVYRRPKVAIFFTGDELVAPGQPLAPGKIYNSNRYLLLSLLPRLGCELLDLGMVADRLSDTEEVLRRAAAQADVVITSGGVSVGEEDHVRHAVTRVGRLDLWKIAVKPGKPFAFGRVGEADFLGLPGNPVSAFVTFCLFVRPFLLKRAGVADPHSRPLMVRAGFERAKAEKRREFLRVRLDTGEDGLPRVRAHPHQGSGVLTSVLWADGLADVAAGRVLHEGDLLPYFPLDELTA